MGIGKLLKSGMVGGLAGMAAKNAGVNVGDIARHGGFGVLGAALARRKRRDGADAPVGGAARRSRMEEGGVRPSAPPTMKKGGKVKKMAKGGSASKRADGCATKGKTKGRFV